jgi:cytolysin (calcineurin-like family phosphatase)
MSLWDRLFSPSAEPDALSAIMVSSELVVDSQINQAAQIEACEQAQAGLQRRVDQLELVVEGLLRELESRGSLDIDTLKQTITALDEQDGVADLRMGAAVKRRLQE